ncbi:hypothetical protein GW17_00017608 [Ensete ventricosum]|nr:hypothetical protein GW17_00017608 [Ensete ventricosum]
MRRVASADGRVDHLVRLADERLGSAVAAEAVVRRPHRFFRRDRATSRKEVELPRERDWKILRKEKQKKKKKKNQEGEKRSDRREIWSNLEKRRRRRRRRRNLDDQMELFSAHLDLSLQISPPNTTPSGWRKPDEKMELGFWRRTLDSTTTTNNNVTASAASSAAAFKLSSVNPGVTDSTTTSDDIFHHPQPHHHLPRLPQGYHQDPIRGIPIYQHPPSFPLLSPHQLQPSQDLPRPRYLPPRFAARRTTRAPRMRWTTTLHARFVHAVELLGGHESMLTSPHSHLSFVEIIQMDGEIDLTFLL